MLARASVSDRDRGYAELRRRAAELARGRAVDVGVQGSEAAGKHADGAVDVVDVATWMEFGTEDVSERSFIRAYVDDHRDELERDLRQIAARAVKGEATIEQGLSRLGLKIQAGIVERIRAGIAPPLAQATIDWKGSSTPLINTGQLVSSITWMLKQMTEAT